MSSGSQGPSSPNPRENPATDPHNSSDESDQLADMPPQQLVSYVNETWKISVEAHMVCFHYLEQSLPRIHSAEATCDWATWNHYVGRYNLLLLTAQQERHKFDLRCHYMEFKKRTRECPEWLQLKARIEHQNAGLPVIYTAIELKSATEVAAANRARRYAEGNSNYVLVAGPEIWRLH